ncbi:hypothetical protein CPB84DRAFT_833995 [Gymnopilus junonius]|uniref:F-box domain-containing protein n=1 Tax=Gymnopilus junonius TaxID=109634 RepID=A0A9P5NQE3_GYMJU|nr:hypothetical protein CPB84DRAFT_833995 [Gymnopilus junonius]
MAGNGVAYIDNLPSELLALIFKFIHDDIKSSRSEKRFEAGLSRSPAVKDFDLSEDEDAEDDDDSDLDSDLDLDVNKFLASQQGIVFSASFPSEFPHSVAGVCPGWEAILSLSPAYWTRVVLPISHATSLEKTRQYLTWSRDLPIDIFILREWENKDYDKVTERELVRSFISFLRPYMRRCRSLHLEVKFNSCLPPLYKIVPNHAPLLKALDIHCAVDDPEAVLLDLTEEENEEGEED